MITAGSNLDALDTRLVVLPPEASYSKGADSAAETVATSILESRGNSPRLYRNTLVFLAADRIRFQDLDEAVRKYLAWRSILDDKNVLDLSPNQVRQAEMQLHNADGAVTARLPETYQWLLVPNHKKDNPAITWQALRLTGAEALAPRASKKLRSEELLIPTLGSTILRKHMDEIPLWRGDHVAVRQVVEDFARYPYLHRVAGPQVILDAIQDGVASFTWRQETFAIADTYDESEKRYRGLRFGQREMVSEDSPDLLIKPNVAGRQLDAETTTDRTESGSTSETTTNEGNGRAGPSDEKGASQEKRARRFYGTVRLNPTRAGFEASRIADEVIAHLAGLHGADVTVTLETEATIPDGAPDHVVRTVTENSRTLKFASQEFEKE